MANEHETKHLSKPEMIDQYYAEDASSEAGRHLDNCARCRAVFATISTHLNGVATDLRHQAMEGLDPYFFQREARAIMARLSAAPPAARPFHLWRRWQPI